MFCYKMKPSVEAGWGENDGGPARGEKTETEEGAHMQIKTDHS